jgi:hypothetical protein
MTDKTPEQELYTKGYAQETLSIIADNLKDLSLWSAYNQDKFNDLIVSIQNVVRTMKEQV